MPLQRAPDVVHEIVGDQAVLVDADGRELITLNETGTLVWQAFDGARDLDGVAREVHDQVEGASYEQVRDDVASFADQLLAEGLVTEVSA